MQARRKIGRKAAFAAVLSATLLGVTGCSFSLFSFGPPPSEASQLAERATGDETANPHAWFFHGERLLREGEPKEARKRFKQALKLSPDYEEALIGIGRSHEAEENWKKAKDAYREALFLNERNLAAREGLSRAHLMTGDLRSAENAVTEALALIPEEQQSTRLPFYAVLFEVAYRVGDFQNALKAWRVLESDGRYREQLGPLAKDLQEYVRKYDPKKAP